MKKTNIRAFAEAWPNVEIVQQAVGQLPWGHNVVTTAQEPLTKLKDPQQRLIYAQNAAGQQMVHETIAGVDEAGRGPLAGAVYAAAVILDPNCPIEGLADSKTLSAKRREALAHIIRAQALAWCVASASVAEIDALNILKATLLAMQRAVQGLGVPPTRAEIDGNQAPFLTCAVNTVIQGDARVPVISAASILAKTARDAELVRLDGLYPHYGFAQHKGYGTRMHLARLQTYGPCPEHRRSFAPVKKMLPP